MSSAIAGRTITHGLNAVARCTAITSCNVIESVNAFRRRIIITRGNLTALIDAAIGGRILASNVIVTGRCLALLANGIRVL